MGGARDCVTPPTTAQGATNLEHGMESNTSDAPLTLLTRDEILKSDDIQYEVVDVPEWGGKVRVRALTGTQRDAFESSMVVGEGKKQKVTTANIRAKLVQLTLVDMNGAQVFSIADINFLGAKSAAALDRVYEVSARLSKISKEDVEELAGNSGTDTSDDSSSASPSITSIAPQTKPQLV
jgi:hypothetical protein